jgi:hypothetical protein
MSNQSLVPSNEPPTRIIVQSSQDPHFEDRERARGQVRQLAWFLDSAFVIPGTKYRIGLDPIIGLIPFVGDLIAMGIGSYLVLTAARLGVPRAVVLRMLLNVGTDVVLGAVPVVGDVLDAAWRANAKNAALLERALADPKKTGRSSAWMLVGLSLLLLALTAGAVLLTIWLAKLIIGAFE